MERERGGAGLDEPRADLEARAGSVRNPSPQLHRDGKIDRFRDGLDEPGRAIGILEHRRAGSGSSHLLHRAAEVQVDDVGAGRLHHARCIGHRPRLAAEELDRERMLVPGDAKVAERALVSMLDARAADHLGAHEPGAVAASLAPKRLHADAGHRRENESRRYLHIGDQPGGPQVDLHSLEW
jgi:hypothetical protein